MMRILIVGGGVAGLTLAALLRQRGEQPMVVEKINAYTDAGYLLSLWPMGNRGAPIMCTRRIALLRCPILARRSSGSML
jgi:flavin-dependent dehydrogenase